MGIHRRVQKLRAILVIGSIVFGVSALWLIAMPGWFNELLGLQTNSSLEWTMRMIGITLVALAGNMYSVSTRGGQESVLFSGWVMLFCALGLGVLTLMLPVTLTWFAILYAVIGFGFSAGYLWAILSK